MCGKLAVGASRLSLLYTIFRICTSFVDATKDGVHSYLLFTEDHVYWGSLTILFIFLPWVVSLLNAMVAKCCNCRSEHVDTNFWRLVFDLYAEVFEAFFESGPELVLQIVIVLHAVHIEEYRELSYWGIFSILGIGSSLASLLISCIRYSQETWNCSWRFITFCWTTLSTVIYKVCVAASLFFVHPVFAAIVMAALYSINLIMYSLFGESFLDNLVHSYYGLWAPVGYAQHKGHAVGYIGEHSVGCIHEKKLPRKILLFHTLNMITNLVLVVPLVLLTLYYPPSSVPLLDQVAPQIMTEYLLIGAPLAALLTTAPALVFLCVVAKDARDYW